MANKNFQVKFGLEVGSTVTADAATGNITTSGDVAVNGGDITTTSTTANIVNATATTVNLGGGATTAVNIGNTAGEIITPSDIKQTGTKSIRQGDGPYVGSTDIYRNNAGNAIEGFLFSNNNMTGASTALVGRNYGQNFPSGTTATAGTTSVFLGASRGTPASPLAVGVNDALYFIAANSNLGDTTGAGTGNGWSNDLYPSGAQPVGLTGFANVPHRQTLQATFTGSISGTTLTVTAVASGTLAPGQEVRGTGFASGNAGYVIVQQLTTTAAGNALGSTGTYQLHATPGTIASSTMTTNTATVGTTARHWTQPPGYVTNTSTVANFSLAPNANQGLGGTITSTGYSNLTLGPAWYGFPVYNRVVTEITGGNTLNIGTHGFTVGATNLGINVFIQTLGNPNGLNSSTTYYVDTVPSSTTITLRTNSVSGGAVTGLTNGTGLFIIVGTAAQSATGVKNASTITLTGARNGHNYTVSSNVGNLKQDDLLGRLIFQGSTSGGSNTNTVLAARTTEDWLFGSTLGSSFVLTTNKTGTTTAYDTTIASGATTFTTDSFTVRTAAGTPVNMLTVDSSGNVIATGDLRINGNDILNSTGNTTITMQTGAAARTIFAGDIEVDGNNIRASDGNVNITTTSNTLTTFAGDIRINGNDIQNSTGNNAIIMNAGATPLVTTAGNIQINGNNIINSVGSTNISLGSTGTTILANNIAFSHSTLPGSLYTPSIQPGTASNRSAFQFNSASTTGSLYSTFNFQNVRFDGTNLSPTQVNDVLGEYKFNGNTASSGSVPSVPGPPGANITAAANENWTNTANGTDFTFSIVKKGTVTSISSLKLASDDIRLRGDQFTLQDSNSVALTSAAVNYTRTYGEFAYTNAAGFNIPAQNTIYTMPLDTTLNNSGVTISGTGNININVSGWYKIIISLQVTLTVSNQPGQIDFWLRKNGADVPNSKTQVDLLKDQKAVIAMDWLVNSDGNDYWEIVYVGTSANYADIDFPTIAATTTPYVSPVAPALIVNVIPAGM